ncbi:hypothetical protein K461DRAFT_225480 [Myriangium duriaei CBS 260.36]|uniref:Uncharacterized protein n=1 Tax=Myriangium duriaei CBS 260.36 TaxID=1168546 RepID=A0A9P4MK89_9PEZI|nr:hypothetical protein K461DRAFT_225480 [Myriangium duriaei CBS 260.36]
MRPGVYSRQVPRVNRTALRYQSTSSNAGSSGGGSHVASGLAGGALAFAAAYGYYSFSAAGRFHSGLNKTAAEANKYYNEATKKFQESTPDANEAIEYLKKTAYGYAAFIPGGRGYVDAAFKDIDTMRENHSDEVDKILRETYTDLQKISKGGLNRDTLQQAFAALEKMSKRLASEAGDAFSSILDNHPGLKDKVGGNFDQLKKLGDKYGPQAKEQVDQTWQEVQDALKGGVGVESINKIRQLVDDKIKKIQQMGDEAWQKGLKEVQPLLEKNPKVKELVEKNIDALKNGNVKEVFDKVQSSIKSGNIEDLQNYVNQAKNKAQKEGSKISGIDPSQLFNMVPGGDKILQRLSQLSEVAEKHRDEGEQLLKETVDELHKVLADKGKRAEELINKVKKQS